MTRQERIIKNKVNKGFNSTDLSIELECLKGEIKELEEGIQNNDRSNILEELADICIYAYGMAEILGANLDIEIDSKMVINENRKYIKTSSGTFIKIK